MNSILKHQMPKKKYVFFRNDDVGLYSRETVARELVNLTNLFFANDIPICHAVVPKAINIETVQWLRRVKLSHPDLISIGQHGFGHIHHGKGEFDRKRTYQQQKKDIEKGLQLMKDYFSSDFSYWFAPPWVKYNRHTKEICDKLGFKIFSGGVSPRLYARVFNAMGRSLNLNVLGFKEVSYHNAKHFSQQNFDIEEVSVSIDVLQSYRHKQIKTLGIILKRFGHCRKYYDVIGFMLHHWAFDKEEKLEIIRGLLHHLKNDASISFCLIDAFGLHK